MPTHEQISIRSGLLLSLRVLVANLIVALVIVGVLVLAVATAAHAEAGCGAAEVEQLQHEGRTLAQEEQLREENNSTALPDCRAYELASPPFEFGQPSTKGGFAALGADGRSVLFDSLGGFGEAGDDSTVYGSAYVARRGEAGWAAEPVSLPGSEFQGEGSGEGGILDVSADMSETLTAEAPVGGPPIDTRFYLRHEGGAISEIGPAIDPAIVAGWTHTNAEARELPVIEYAGATPDFSRVFFYSTRLGSNPADFLWPGDSTVVFRSLYEYVGAGHTGVGGDVPALVGVSDGRTVVDGSTLAAGKLISQCGIALGGLDSNAGNGTAVRTFNAIADEGHRVFFTAFRGGCENHGLVGEGPSVTSLYMRVDDSQTVAVSDPTKEDCAECNTLEGEEAKGHCEHERERQEEA